MPAASIHLLQGTVISCTSPLPTACSLHLVEKELKHHLPSSAAFAENCASTFFYQLHSLRESAIFPLLYTAHLVLRTLAARRSCPRRPTGRLVICGLPCRLGFSYLYRNLARR